jgi:hypothetical protein
VYQYFSVDGGGVVSGSQGSAKGFNPIHTETPTHIVPRTHDQYGNSTE